MWRVKIEIACVVTSLFSNMQQGQRESVISKLQVLVTEQNAE